MSTIENSDDVGWLIEEVYQMGGASGDNYAEEKMSWKDHDYSVNASILTSCDYSRAEGGQDGFAIGLSKGNWKTVSQALTVYGDPALDPHAGDYHTVTVPAGAHTGHGASWTWQDNTRYVYIGSTNTTNCAEPINGYSSSTYMDLDDYRGIMTWEFFNSDGVCVSNVYVTGDYIHTWSSVDVSGISVGTDGSSPTFTINYGVAGTSRFENTSNGAYATSPLC